MVNKEKNKKNISKVNEEPKSVPNKTSRAKEKIKKNFPSSACCEMEGGSIGHVCYVNGTPFVVLRAISDKADGTGNMDYMQFCGIAADNSVKVMSEFIKEI